MDTINITGQTIIRVGKLRIDGINPDRLTYTVREYWDPEGSVYEVEHVPTKITYRDWTSNGLEHAVAGCRREVEHQAKVEAGL